VTYADFMTLLLCLFVAILSMSTIQKGSFDKALGSLQTTFGGAGADDADHPAGTTLEEKLSDVAPAVGGDEREIQTQLESRGVCLNRMEHGHRLVIGGKKMFERGAHVPSGDAELIAARLAELLAADRQRIIVRGHAAGETPKEEGFDIRELSYRRAVAIARFLEEGGVSPNRIDIVAMGEGHSLLGHTYSESRRAFNRRVEIEIIETETPEPVRHPVIEKKG